MSQSELTLETLDGEQYRFRYPRLVMGLDDMVFDAIDLIECEEFVEAKKLLHAVIDAFPNHIDAHHHLALCLLHQGEVNVAFNTWQKAVETGLSCLPEGVVLNDIKLEWGWHENRPFLRAYHALGLELYERGSLNEALLIFESLLHINPEDNQGVRVPAIKVNFDLNNSKNILKLCTRFPDDSMAETLYGRLLALYQLQNKSSRQALKIAIETFPSIAEEIVKSTHSEFEDMLYGDDFDEEEVDALEYWENFGEYWEETEGAIQFLAEGLLEYGQKK